METKQTGKQQHTTWFCKRVNAHWQLVKLFHIGPSQLGKSPYYESHLLRHIKNGSELSLADAEWADVDGNRLLWAQQGKLLVGRVTEHGLKGQTALYDANALRFTELVAPY